MLWLTYARGTYVSFLKEHRTSAGVQTPSARHAPSFIRVNTDRESWRTSTACVVINTRSVHSQVEKYVALLCDRGRPAFVWHIYAPLDIIHAQLVPRRGLPLPGAPRCHHLTQYLRDLGNY